MGRPSDVEGSCEYVEDTVAGSRQGVVLHLGVGRGLRVSHGKKKSGLIRNVTRSLGVGCCEHGDEPLGSIKGGEFVD
jgi:hypothetical protein